MRRASARPWRRRRRRGGRCTSTVGSPGNREAVWPSSPTPRTIASKAGMPSPSSSTTGADDLLVLARRGLAVGGLGRHAVDAGRGDAGAVEQRRLRPAVVAAVVGRRHRALVDPEHVDLGPVEARLAGEQAVGVARRVAAGEGERGASALGDGRRGAPSRCASRRRARPAPRPARRRAARGRPW